jgi:hypothetical protein
MQLRHHRLIVHGGRPAWPPAFGGSYGRGGSFAQHEPGELTGVQYFDEAPDLPPHLSLTVRHQGRMQTGELILDDVALLPFLAHELLRFINRPLAEVGSMNLDAALEAARQRILDRLKAGALPRTMAAAAPLAPGRSPASAMQIGEAQGRHCAGCDQPILTRRRRTFYGSPARPVVLDELCERIWEEEITGRRRV